MNFLAHALLSPSDSRVMVGNLIGDLVRDPGDLPPGLRDGVALHRRLDTVAGRHPAFLRGARRLSPALGHYARTVVDVFYDHILARHFEEYAGELLETFIDRIDADYRRVVSMIHGVPLNAWADLQWLSSYTHEAGVRRSLARLSRRSRYNTDLTAAMPLLEVHRTGLKADLDELLPALQAEVSQRAYT